SQFINLLEKNSENVQKISFGSNDRILGELKDWKDLPSNTKEEEDLKRRFEKKDTKKFVTRRWPLQDQELSKQLTGLINKKNLKVEVPDDPYAWVGPVFLFLLPALLLLCLFFFLMPRFRD